MPEAEAKPNGATQQSLPLTSDQQWARAEKQAEAFDAAQLAGMSQSAAMKAAKQAVEEPAEEPPAEKAEEKPPEPAEEAPKQETQPAAEPPGDAGKPSERDQKREQLQSLAAELGLKVDERVVTPDDRVQFRAEKRKFRAGLAQQQKELATQGAQYKAFQDAQAAFATGDVWAGLEKLGQDPNELNKAAARRLSPELQAQHESDKRIAQLEKERADERAQREQMQARQAYLEECRDHRAEIAADWAKSDDPVYQRAAKNVGLLEQARAHAEKVKRQDGEDISPAEAAAAVLPRGREAYEKLKAIFGDQATPPKPENGAKPKGSQAAPKSAASGDTGTIQSGQDSATHGGKPPKAIPQSSAAEVRAPRPKNQTEAEWKRRWSQKLQESVPLDDS